MHAIVNTIVVGDVGDVDAGADVGNRPAAESGFCGFSSVQAQNCCMRLIWKLPATPTHTGTHPLHVPVYMCVFICVREWQKTKIGNGNKYFRTL